MPISTAKTSLIATEYGGSGTARKSKHFRLSGREGSLGPREVSARPLSGLPGSHGTPRWAGAHGRDSATLPRLRSARTPSARDLRHFLPSRGSFRLAGSHKLDYQLLPPLGSGWLSQVDALMVLGRGSGLQCLMPGPRLCRCAEPTRHSGQHGQIASRGPVAGQTGVARRIA
jgi:hypothetical protein